MNTGYRNESAGLPIDDHVLQSDSVVSASDYQQQRLADSYKKLLAQNASEQSKLNAEADRIRFYNLSIREFGERAVVIWSIVLRELYGWTNTWKTNETWGQRFNRLMDIITREDRMIYIGVFLVGISLLMYFFAMPETAF